MMYGVLQERVMTQPYGKEGQEEFFTYTLFLVLTNRLITCLTAGGTLAVEANWAQFKPVAPVWAYAAVSISNVMATTCQYEALKYVSFPVQTLAKCAKMVPVMIWGMLIMRKVYGAKDYLIAVLVAVGCTVFILTGETSSNAAKHNNSMTGSLSSMFGILLMCGYLGFDGFTSTFQEKLFKGFTMSMQNQIMFVTFFSAIFSLFGLVSSGQFVAGWAFIGRHPEVLGNMLTLSTSVTIGQFFISYTIKNYGALIFATIMTTRQFLSILLSCVLFFHPLSAGQWLGTAIVFGTLYFKAFSKGSKSNESAKPSALPTTEDQKPLVAAEQK